jgi:phosphoglucosamine mutase
MHGKRGTGTLKGRRWSTRELFGAEGVSGVANTYPMTCEAALKLGMAAGKIFSDPGCRPRVVVGKDTRLSGYMIESALIAGFTSAGMDVFQLGPVPTPAVAMLTRSLRADLGVMISASGKAYEENGIKLYGPDGYRVSGEREADIAKLMEDVNQAAARPDKIGRATRIHSASERYVEFVKRTLPRGIRFDGIRAVIDCANGAAYKVAPAALWELGAEVVSLGVSPNGLNINKDCGSTSPDHVASKVKEVRADIGIALNGDAERVVIVDERGHIVDGDQLIGVVAESLKRCGQLSGGGILSTVHSSLALERFLRELDLVLERAPVENGNMIESMRRTSFNLGGDSGGQIILSDISTTGDGLVVALHILAVLAQSGGPVSRVCNIFDPAPEPSVHGAPGPNQPPGASPHQ